MPSGRTPARRPLTALLLAVAMVSGCQGGGPLTATNRPGANEGRISSDAWGNVNIALGGRNFRIKAADLKPIGDVSVQAGGKFYTLREGRFAMPEHALREVKENSRAFFRVFVSGYVPKQVWIGQADDDVMLSPQRALAVSFGMGPLGGELRAKDSSVAIKVPTGMLEKPGTKVALSGYQPEIRPEDTEIAVAERNGFLAKVRAKAGRAYALVQATACEDADDPLPCPPPTESLGLMMTVDGPMKPGQMTATIDLAAYLRGWDGQGQPPWVSHPGDWTPEQAAQARSADKILRTYGRMKSHGNGQSYEEVMAAEYGVQVRDGKLIFTVNVGVDDTVDGFVRTDVEGVSLLGVKLEFTAVSSLNQSLPAAAMPPAMIQAAPGAATRPMVDAASLIGLDGASLVGMDAASLIGLDGASLVNQQTATLIGADGASLIGLDGGSLIGLDGASLVGMDAASLIGLDGASLIGLDGASLIGNDAGSLAGGVQVPFAPNQAKYAVQAYEENVLDGGSVRLLDWDGTYLSAAVPIQPSGWYVMHGLPATKPFFLVEATVGAYKLYAVAIAPGKKLTSVRIDAATTVVAAGIWDAVRRGRIDPTKMYLPKYNRLVAKAKAALTQAPAQAAVTVLDPTLVQPNPPALAAASALGLLAQILGVVVGVLIPAPQAAPPPASYAGLQMSTWGSGVTLPRDIVANVSGTKGYITTGTQEVYLDQGAGLNAWITNSERPAGPALPNYRGIAGDTGNVYIADAANNAIIVYKHNKTDLKVYRMATATKTLDPHGVVVASDGTIWFTSYGFDCIGYFRPGLDTQPTLLGEGGTTFSRPEGIAIAPNGEVYVADTGNHRIVKLAIDGRVMAVAAGIQTDPTPTVVAGSPTATAGRADGLPGAFAEPTDIEFDGSGNLVVVDRNNHAIRIVRPDGTVETLAGSGTPGNQNGANALAATFNSPGGIGLDKFGALIVADTNNNLIRASLIP